MKELIYKTVKLLAKVCIRFFYRGIEIGGKENVPTQGPFIYAVNHQNAFLDAIIIGALSPVPTYFMTRSDVFKPPFDWFLDALKMMPIYRIRDGYKSLSKNDMIFETCKNLLEKKQAILIFPEGNHGLDYYLRPLTKGIARIALQSQSVLNEDIKIIPVGLNYFNHFSSGHKLILRYGQAISVSDFIPSYEEHKQKGLRSITKSISEGMMTTLVIPADSDNYEMERNLFQRKNEGLTFEELQERKSNPSFTQEEKKHAWLGWIGEFFSIFNLLPLLLTKYIIETKVSQKIFQASIKVGALLLVFPIWFILVFIITWICFGINWAIGVFVLQILTLLIRRELVRFSH